MRIGNAQQIAEWRLCVGCGACQYICPEKNISLVNLMHDGIRPRVDESHCKKCGDCLRVCPGIDTAHASDSQASELVPGIAEGWGPILEVWEGHAVDQDIRHMGSSGGVATALALYCIEQGGMEGALHVGPDEEKPLENRTVFSRNRSQLLARTGSRYSPASPCDSLGRIECPERPSVFIGKPCDVAALRKAGEMRPALERNVGVSIGIFCAGTPASEGTVDLCRELGIDPDSVEELRYRGRGWPGKFAVRLKGEGTFSELSTYMASWGFIQKYRPYRCYLCPDGTSEFADISCGDPWYRERREEEAGQSLVLVRTERGRVILRAALEAGYVALTQASAQILVDSQRNLLSKRGAIWGRLFAMKMFGIPTPRLKGFSLFQNWRKLSLNERVRSVAGTARRVLQRAYYRPEKLL